MKPSLPAILRQAEGLRSKELLEGYAAFVDWHDACLEYLEMLIVEFREKVRTPMDIDEGIGWIKSTFREPE